MVIKKVKKKTKETAKVAAKNVKPVVELAGKAGKKVERFAQDAGEMANRIMLNAKDRVHDAQIKVDTAKYRPIFEPINLDDFGMVYIGEKDKKRSESEACDNSLGHYETIKKGLTVLNIYKKNAIKFPFEYYPNKGYGFYYISPINSNKLIKLEDYFEYVKDQKVAELHDIAYKIGASYVEIKYKEEKKTFISKNYDFKARFKVDSKNEVNAEQKHRKTENDYSDFSVLDCAHYHNQIPTHPELNFFAGDKKIETLIEAALRGEADDRHITIKYNSTKTIDKDTAIKIDVTLKQYKAEGNCSITSEVERESRTELDFYVEFPKK